MNGKKMEEIQARRGFFKSASKGAMPMMTLLDVAASSKLFGGGSCLCYGNCSGCSGTCKGGCQYGCGSNCKHGGD